MIYCSEKDRGEQTMFDIAVHEWGKTYNADELVKDKTETEIGNAKKRRYFCVACVGGKHPVSLKVRHTMAHIDPTQNYTALAWFSHHGCGGLWNWGHDNHCPETAKHWQAKHILSQHAARCCFVTSQCTGCLNHTKIENGLGTTGKVEFTEMTDQGTKHIFLMLCLCVESLGVLLLAVFWRYGPLMKRMMKNVSIVWTRATRLQNFMLTTCSKHIRMPLTIQCISWKI